MYLPNENSDKLIENYLDYYYYCGQITAKALYERIPIKAYFSKIIFKKLLDEEVTIEDMKYCDLELYESMQYILNSQITEGDSLSNFTCTKKDPISGKIITIELKENGTNIQVDDSNKVEFVNLLFNELFIKNTKLQIEEIISGFMSLLPKSMITVLDSDELELFICGEVTIDVDDWKKNTIYDEPYNSTHPVIVNFWQMVKEMSADESERLLQFCTGSRRPPAEGFKGLRAANDMITFFRISPGSGGNDGLIIAHTCFNNLELPMYDNIVTMKTMINNVLHSPNCFKFTVE